MDSHRKSSNASALRPRPHVLPAILGLVALILVSATAAIQTGCKSTEPARIQADDATITAKVKEKLATDSDLVPSNIDVTTNAGVVTLQGQVKKEELRGRAERDARRTDGVKRVINLVKVGDSQ